jgi:hypothetical protein
MQQQIDFCANHGIAFWAFDWEPLQLARLA